MGPLEEANAIGLTSVLFTKFKLIKMACRDDEAVEMASIMDNWLCDAVAAQNRPTNMAGFNVGNKDNETKFNCSIPECNYVTPSCDSKIAHRRMSVYGQPRAKEGGL